MRDALTDTVRRNDPRHLINGSQVEAIVDQILEAASSSPTLDDLIAIIRSEDATFMWPRVQVEAIARDCAAVIQQEAVPGGGIRP